MKAKEESVNTLQKQANNMDKRKKYWEHWQVIACFLVIYDIIAVNFSYFFGLWLRFDFLFSKIPAELLNAYLRFAPFYTAFIVLVFWYLRLYKSIWRFAGFSELLRITAASVVTAVFHTVAITLFVQRMPVSYYVVGALIQFCMIIGIRFSYRLILMERSRLRARSTEAAQEQHVMIIGAGAAGQVILRELKNAKETNAQVCCFIDDNSNKWNRFVEGVPVAGGRDDILVNVEKYKIDQILLAMPSATAQEKRDILNICKESGCELKSLPGVYQLVNGEVSMSKMKNVAVEDLLGRDPIKVNMEEIFQYIKDKTILVTGGGGSIGSELCRQIAGHKPKQLIIFDIYENNVYDIEQELKASYPELKLSVLIGSVRNTRRINWVFENYKPDIVYHAAAHKHVPLMEASPCEAIKNNVMGTYKTAYAALRNGCRKFVLISTDKAVNPTNIMGASKRLCEMVIQSMDQVSKNGNLDLLPQLRTYKDKATGRRKLYVPVDAQNLDDGETADERNVRTEFVAVRFGNVLGSNGSVIPLFRKQIEKGGPVTVTHPDIIRYFMTIPEAVSLVLQAGTYAKGGEIFVLDMGEPMKIDTLARNLIKLSGYKPDEDIKVVYTGLRPGEKLYEEKLMEEEGMQKTPNQMIHIGQPIPMDVNQFFRQLEMLNAYCEAESSEIVRIVAGMVPTFQPSGEDGVRIRHEADLSNAEAAATSERQFYA